MSTATRPGPAAGPGRGRPGGPMRGPMGGGPMGGGLGMPVEKPANFRETLRRVLGLLHPERLIVGAVLVLALTSVAFAVAGPKLLGNATNVLLLSTGGVAALAPILGIADPEDMSDPLPQALILTAIVITFGSSRRVGVCAAKNRATATSTSA